MLQGGFGYHSQLMINFHSDNGSSSLWTFFISPDRSWTLIHAFILDPTAPSYETCLKSEFRLIPLSTSLNCCPLSFFWFLVL